MTRFGAEALRRTENHVLVGLAQALLRTGGMTLSSDAERLPQRADDLDALRDELEQADWCSTEAHRGRRHAPAGDAHRTVRSPGS